MASPIIILDPGHGFHKGYGSGKQDPGAVAFKKTEEEYAQIVATAACKILEHTGKVLPHLTHSYHWRGLKPRNYNPVRSGTTDALSWRRDMARDTQAALFVSVHWNSAFNPLAHGTETFHRPNASKESVRLARCVQRSAMGCLNHYDAKKQVADWSPTDRGVKQSRLGVLSNSCPSCLFECEFINNKHVNKLMDDESFLWTLSNGIAQGILVYLGISPT